MRVWTDRDGKPVEGKEFIERWKSGINNINPYQLAKTEMMGQLIMLAGILIGLGTSLYNKQWWLSIILFGGLIVSGVSIVGVKQKVNALASVYKSEKEVVLNEQQSTA